MLGMGIVKIEVKLPELAKAVDEFRRNRLKAFETMMTEFKSAVSRTFNQLLNAEMTLFLGKPDQLENKRNGYYEREYALKGIGCVRIKMPRDRLREFESAILPAREQIDPRLREDLAVLHLSGISTRTLSLISKRILGITVSPSTVNRSLESVEASALAWLTRPLTSRYWALFIDGTNFKIQRRDSMEKEPALVVLGIDDNNRMSILAIEPGRKDDTHCWRTVFEELKRRGLDGSQVRIGIMDGLPGLEKVFAEEFDKSVTARCWVHALRNALAKTPSRLSESFKMLAHRVMYANSEDAARSAFDTLKKEMGGDALGAVRCLEKDLESLLVHYRFEKTMWRSLKTTNPIERVNKELKRRTKVMEGMGERTMRVVTAFTALRLEHGWQRLTLNDRRLNNLKPIKLNTIELAMETLAQ